MLTFQTNSVAVSALGGQNAAGGVATPQNTQGKFTSQTEPMNASFTDFAAMTWEFLFGGSDRSPDFALPVEPVELAHFTNPQDGQLNVTWLGHSSLMINIDGYKILTDPVFEKRVSLLGPTRFNGDVPLDIDSLPPVDAVIISHDHYDHLNKFTVQRLRAKTGRFIVPLGVDARLEQWGIPSERIVALEWWEAFDFDGRLMVVATPAQHFSGRGLTDRNRTLWASWVIKTPAHRIFFSGDSGYFDGFKRIGERYGPFDMTFIECGAYNESWAGVHMFPEQTVQAHIDLKGNVLHPIHWGTFNLALHPWFEPMERLTSAAIKRNIETATPIVGETTVYGGRLPDDKWWHRAMVLKETVDNYMEN